MMQIEQSYFSLAESNPHNCLIICDRGAMDASACETLSILSSSMLMTLTIISHSIFSLCSVIAQEKWEKIMQRNRMNAVDLRDSRYNHIIHMVSAAHGAEQFYSLEVCPFLISKGIQIEIHVPLLLSQLPSCYGA